MVKRIYTETVKSWGKVLGISGVSLFGLIFMYLIAVGSISNVTYSGDMVCAGTIDDPCYAYINFTAEDDIFIYPTNYDPWGRDTLFNFDPNVKSWRLERSWGKSWRNIPINTTCTGTWCGAKDNKGCAYSMAFRKDRDYQIRIVAYKNNPTDTLKWGAFSGIDEIDPFWYGVNETPTTLVSGNISVELGTPINFTTNLTGATTTCVDIDHPDYGDNYTCGTPNADFTLNISYFRETEFNDSETVKTINASNLTVYIAAHQYDEVQNLSFNITGIEDAKNVKIWINDTETNNLGLVYNTSSGSINETDGTIFNLVNGNSTTFSIPKGATVTNTTMNFTGSNLIWESSSYSIPEQIDSTLGSPSFGRAYWLCYLPGWNECDSPYTAYDGKSNTAVRSYLEPLYALDYTSYIYENYTIDSSNNLANWSVIYQATALAPFTQYCWTGSWTQIFTATTSSYSSPTSYNIPTACLSQQKLYIKTTMEYAATSDLNTGVYSEGYVTYYREQPPENMTIEVGIVDGVYEYQGFGELTGSNSTTDFVDAVNIFLDTCAADDNGYCDVPIYFSSDDGGKLSIDNFEVLYTYDPNPIIISSSIVQNFLSSSTDDVDIPIYFSMDDGSFNVSDLRYDYKGGNDTIDVFVWDYSNTLTDQSINNFNKEAESINISIGTFTKFIDIPMEAMLSWAYLNFTGYNTSFECYQEYPETSTACGGLDTGVTYVPSGSWYNGDQALIVDGDWDTGCHSYFYLHQYGYLNYSKPSDTNIDGSYWQIKTGSGLQNVSITSTCWAQSPLQLRFASNSSNSFFSCWNGTEYETLLSGTNREIYEEAMWWNITSYPRNVSLEIGDSDGDYEFNETGYLQNNITGNLSEVIETVLLGGCSCDSCVLKNFNHICSVPFVFDTNSVGELEIHNLNITYDTMGNL